MTELAPKSPHRQSQHVSKVTCSVVVPVYNGAETIPLLVERLGQVLPSVARKYEVILVNDGSHDNSWAVIEGFRSKYPWVIGVNLMRNYGQHNATLCGVRKARYDVTITMDDDLQHPPEEIPILLAELSKGYDVVYGAPIKLPQGFLRNVLTKSIKVLLARIMGIPSIRNISAFRAFYTHLRNAFTEFRSPSLILDVLLSWGTSYFTSVPVNISASTRRSNYSFVKLMKAALLILTGFSTAPLRITSWLGFLMTIFGMGILAYVLFIYFNVGSLPGFPFLASVIAIFSGAQLFTMGIFGEYLARMFDRVMDRPPYIVEQQFGGAKR